MVLELATVLLGASVGVIAVVYAASRGYLGRKKTKAASTPAPSIESYATSTEHAPKVPTADAPSAVEHAPFPTPEPTPEPSPEPTTSFYETVQPPPAPITYALPFPSSSESPTLTKKPTRTYRRRSAPVRGAAGSRKPKKTLSK
jgi:hypothetical protein